MNTSGVDLHTLAIGLLIARIVVGLGIASHGAQKLFGWFGGYGLNATGEFMVQLGFRPGRTFAALAALGELTSGILVTLGLLGPIGPALMISVMIVAMVSVHAGHGFFATNNGIELPLLYATAGFSLAMIGFGPYSLDAVLGIAGRWTETTTWIVLGAGIVGGFANLGLRRRPASPAKA